MTDFVLVPSKLPDAVNRMTAVPEFRASQPFQDLTAEERAMSWVIAATFGRLAMSSATPVAVATRLLAVLDELAAWNDLDVDNLLQVEIIELIDPTDLQRLRSLFGENLMRVVADSEERWGAV
jgi:hypothetical protein